MKPTQCPLSAIASAAAFVAAFLEPPVRLYFSSFSVPFPTTRDLEGKHRTEHESMCLQTFQGSK